MSVAGRLYLIDVSALARAGHSQVRYTVSSLITDGVAATCATIDLAAGFSGRTAADLAVIDSRRRDRYRNLPLTEAAAGRARAVQAQLAEAGQHRAVGIIDLLTAAVAEAHDAAVVHYAAAFELIASVTGQPHLWVAPRGSLEAVGGGAPLPPAPAVHPVPGGPGASAAGASPSNGNGGSALADGELSATELLERTLAARFALLGSDPLAPDPNALPSVLGREPD